VSDDADLLLAWRAGDIAAGQQLMRRYIPTLHRFFRFKVRGAIEDMVQRTLLRCVEARDEIRQQASFRAYLLAIARNELYGHFRSMRGVELASIGLSSLHDLDPSPSEIVARREETRLLLEALRRVPLDVRLALELHYWERCTNAEIAEVLATPIGTVKTRIRRGRSLLRSAIESLGAAGPVVLATLSSFDEGAPASSEEPASS
jgi:RNA polymerase sigma factor (sigma-70 family)